jgi:Uma2 family endonuclease
MLGQQAREPSPWRVSRVDYHRLGELGFFGGKSVELIRGTVVEMAPIGPAHQSAIDRLTELFVLGMAGRARVRVQGPFVGEDESEPEPDVAVVPVGDYRDDHPAEAFLVVEVASSSFAFDRDTKGPLYAQSRVREYWIVDLVERCVWVHRAPSANGYAQVERVSPGATVSPEAFPDVAVAVADLVG